MAITVMYINNGHPNFKLYLFRYLSSKLNLIELNWESGKNIFSIVIKKNVGEFLTK